MILNFFFFTFPKTWVGRAMGNETFYWDGPSGIDETSNVVQLNGFLGKRFYFYNLFSQSATLPVYLFNLCLYLSISCQSSFFHLTIFQR